MHNSCSKMIMYYRVQELPEEKQVSLIKVDSTLNSDHDLFMKSRNNLDLMFVIDGQVRDHSKLYVLVFGIGLLIEDLTFNLSMTFVLGPTM